MKMMNGRKMLSALLSLLLAGSAVFFVPVTAAGGGELDLEFSTRDSVSGFTAGNGNVSWNDGRLVWALGDGQTLTSPKMSYTQGTAYGVKLELRNTLCVRMSNKTDAKSLRLYFLTEGKKDYTDEASETFDVLPQSADTTYLFNLSANSRAKGKLIGFRFELVGAKGGTVEIDAITFEHEKAIYNYAGHLTACTVSGDKVKITGTLLDEYAGKTVTLYETQVENYTEALKSNEAVASVKADGRNFTIEIPLSDGKVSRLSAMFLLGVDGTRVCDRFMVENWRDFLKNPYAFDTADKTVRVTDAPYNAKGDGFTNDTDAIQKAIDDMSAAGGGRVVVPGSTDEYGRRYIVTTVRLKDNVELHLEEGSVLWQSPRPADYPYEVAYGHDVSIPGVNWTHAGLCHNYPMIYAFEANHIKLTGSGTLRSVDTGSECLDSVSGDMIWVGCENRIHIISVAMQYCDDVEISDIHIRRANCYHMMVRNSHRVWIANVDMREATCASGDGVGVSAGCTDVEVDRCILYSNDDALTLCCSYDDPRGLVWWHSTPGTDNSIRHITARSCNLFGGHGITFIPWGTDDPDLSHQIIEDIYVTDSVLCGGGYAVGTWPDNPYFGKTFDNTETDDFSPVQNVTITGNRYRGQTNLECLRVTGLITDCGLRAATDFEYGNFEHRKVKRVRGKTVDMVNGLSGWEYRTADTAENEPASLVTALDMDGNHVGAISNGGSLYQGLYMCQGKHTVSLDVEMPEKGNAVLFVKNRVTGETVAQKEVRANRDAFFTNILTFTLERAATLDIGIETDGGYFLIDNASVSSNPPQKSMYFTEDFENGDSINLVCSGMDLVTEDGNTFMRAEGGLGGMCATGDYTDYTVTYRMRYHYPTWDVDGNFGMCTCMNGDDQYFLEYNTPGKYIQLRRFYRGNTTALYSRGGVTAPAGEWVDCSLTSEGGHYVWTVDGETYIEFDDTTMKKGQIYFNFYSTMIDIDDITVTPLGADAAPEYETGQPQEDPTEAEFIPDTEPETEPYTEPETGTQSGETPVETDPEITGEDVYFNGSEPDGDTNPQTGPDTTDTAGAADTAGCASALVTGLAGLISAVSLGFCLAVIRKRKGRG